MVHRLFSTAKFETAYINGTRKQVKYCDIYLKAENGVIRAYYVINGKAEGAFIDL